MGKDIAGYTNLDTVVKSVNVSLKRHTMHDYRRLLQFAAEGFSSINLFVTEQVKVEYLTVKPNLTVDLPDDFIYYSKIGILINGKVYILSMNEDIALPRKTDECGLTLSSLTECSPTEESGFFPTWGYYFANHFRNGQYVGEMFGIGGGFNDAHYKIDWGRRQIVLNSLIAVDEIILEYKSSGISADGCTVIPRETLPALREYVHWKRVEYNPKVAMNDKKNREKQYYIEYEKLNFLETSFTMQEYLDHTYSETKSSPRR